MRSSRHTSVPRTRRGLVVLAAMAMTVAACGDDGDPVADVGEADPAASEEDVESATVDCGDVVGLDSTQLVQDLGELADGADGDLADALSAAADAVASDDLGGALTAGTELAEACDEPTLVETLADAWHLPGVEARPAFVCAAANDESAQLLTLLGDEELVFEPTLTIDEIDPVPAEGDPFTATFTGVLELPGEVIDGVIELGITSAEILDTTVRLEPGEGVEGEPLVANPDPASYELEAGVGVSYTAGPFPAEFSRSGPLGSPMTFVPGAMDLTLATVFTGLPINLAVTCAPAEGTTITMTETLRP